MYVSFKLFTGAGHYPKRGQEDPDLINALKETITIIPGGSYISTTDAFAIIRGHHLNLTMMGGMEVSSQGDLANWIYPGKIFKVIIF